MAWCSLGKQRYRNRNLHLDSPQNIPLCATIQLYRSLQNCSEWVFIQCRKQTGKGTAQITFKRLVRGTCKYLQKQKSQNFKNKRYNWSFMQLKGINAVQYFEIDYTDLQLIKVQLTRYRHCSNKIKEHRDPCTPTVTNICSGFPRGVAGVKRGYTSCRARAVYSQVNKRSTGSVYDY